MNDALKLAYKVSLLTFMAGSLLDMGLKLNVQDAIRGLRNLRFVSHSLFWSFGFCPALAWVLSRIIPIEHPYAIGLLLLGMAPCAPFVPILVTKARGDLGYTAAFMFLAAAGTVVFMPIALPLMVQGLTTTAWAIAKPLLIVVLIPMAIGGIINAKSPSIAGKLRPVVEKLTGICALVWCVVALILYGKSLLGVAGSFAIGTQILFFGLLYVCTYTMSFGLPWEQKVVLGVGVTTRNLGASLTPLLSVPDMDQRATLMILLSLPTMVLIALLGPKWLPRPAEPVATAQVRMSGKSLSVSTHSSNEPTE